MSANDKRGYSLRLLALGVSSTAVLLFTSFLAAPTLRPGPYPGADTEPGVLMESAAAEDEAIMDGAAAVLESASAMEAMAPGIEATVTEAEASDSEAGTLVRASYGTADAAPVAATATPAASSTSRPSARGATTRAVTFRDQQLAFPRVARAFRRKSSRVESLFRTRKIGRPSELYLRVFKREQELEVWARPAGATRFSHLTTYPVCKVSGRLGPKRRQGDAQIPEGFYTIDLFNPWSSYHLSMRVSYPNAVDAARGVGEPLGGNIFVHGGCATIGCVPITDSYIQELYVMAVEARSAGQRRIPIHIYPTRLDSTGMNYLRKSYGGDFIDFPFWQNLEQGYAAFEQTRMLPRIRSDGGRYAITPPAQPVAAGQ